MAIFYDGLSVSQTLLTGSQRISSTGPGPLGRAFSPWDGGPTAPLSVRVGEQDSRWISVDCGPPFVEKTLQSQVAHNGFR